MKERYCFFMIFVFCCIAFNMPVKAYTSPIIQLCDYNKIRLCNPEKKIPDISLQDALDEELLPYALEKTDSTRKIQKNDVVEITYSVKRDNKIYNERENITDFVCVGAGFFDRAVETALIDKQKGDTIEVPSTFLKPESSYYRCIEVQYHIHVDNVSF